MSLASITPPSPKSLSPLPVGVAGPSIKTAVVCPLSVASVEKEIEKRTADLLQYLNCFREMIEREIQERLNGEFWETRSSIDDVNHLTKNSAKATADLTKLFGNDIVNASPTIAALVDLVCKVQLKQYTLNEMKKSTSSEVKQSTSSLRNLALAQYCMRERLRADTNNKR